MPLPVPAARSLEARSGAAITPLAAAVLAAGCCALLAPAVVNGDGLGYLRAALAGERVPGHLAFLPLLRLLALVTARHDPLALLGPSRVMCWLAASLAAAALCATAHRLAGARAAAVAGLGMVGSYGLLQAGSDVESYAPALAALCIALWCASRRSTGGAAAWLLATAAFAALSALLHVENALFIPVAGLAAATAGPGRFRRSDGLLVAALGGALVACAYGLAAHARGDDLASAARWIASASHGYRYPLGPRSPALAVYGMARTLVHAPYPIEASWAAVLAQTSVGVAALAALAWLAARPARARILAPVTVAAWAAPYATVGLLFFASDNERWLFLLPLAWLLAGAGAAASARTLRIGLAVGATLLALSLALGLPRARDATRRDRADAVAALLRPGDLVVSPGHGWDEYVGFYRPLAIEPFPMVYFCGKLGGAAAMARELSDRAARARSAGHRVFLLRGDDRADREGWKDLALFGVTPERIDALLPALLPGRRVAVAPGVERVD